MTGKNRAHLRKTECECGNSIGENAKRSGDSRICDECARLEAQRYTYK